ncbi:MAG: divergent polysaccharide deacetylase family protein [Candidatus Omnitrophota bacterium]|nr:divergent polysaccharide deacetylase family protein [Candidatus Omnitrophota bacterium]
MTRRGRRRRLSAKGKGYRIAVEIILAIAVLEGAFFIINNYLKSRPRVAGIGVTRPKAASLKTQLPRLKVETARVETPKPKPERRVALKPRPPRAVPQGKIAIVLDDWGYSLNNIALVDEIKFPFTAAVLPNLRYSQEAAEELHKRGFEIILHLPMESQSKLGMEKNTILISMGAGEIRAIVEQDLDNLGYARGVNNHMGSKVTQDSRVMEEVFGELKDKRLYFLDSAVTAGSVSSDLARRMNVPFIKRDVFLDNRLEPEYIKGQFNKLKTVAKKNGFAVGIGHDRRVTLEILKEIMPGLEQEGYQLVFVSELVH